MSGDGFSKYSSNPLLSLRAEVVYYLRAANS